MNPNGLANMIFRRLLRQGMNKGVQKILGATGPAETGQERQRRALAQANMKRANQAIRLIRMFTRMR